MAKRKDSRALFELISKNREKRIAAKLAVPEWMGKDGPPVLPEQEPPPDSPPELSPPAVRAEPPRLPAAGRPQRQAEPLLALEGDRLKLSLSVLSIVVAGLGLAVLLLGAFWLGRLTAPAPGKEVAAPGGNGGEKGTDSGKKPGSGHTGKPVKTVAGLQPGKYYLVIQTLMGSSATDLADARKIQKFCEEKSLPARVMSYAPRAGARARYMVWSLKPFTLAETTGPEARKHAAEVAELGKEYSRITNGRHSFKQGTDERGQIEGWFLPFRQP